MCAGRKKSCSVRRYCFVDLVVLFFFRLLLLCVRIGDLAVVIHRRIFGHRNSALIQSVVVVVAAVFFYMLGGNLFFVIHFCALM